VVYLEKSKLAEMTFHLYVAG